VFSFHDPVDILPRDERNVATVVRWAALPALRELGE